MAETISAPQLEEEEAAIEEEKEVDIGMSDEELVKQINTWMNEAVPYHEELKKIQDKNEQYYLGNQTKRDQIPRYMSKLVENRIFMAIESIVPIATSRPSEFVAVPAENNEVSIGVAEDTQNILKFQFERLKIQLLKEITTRHMLKFRFGVWKVFWNKDKEDIDVSYVRPQRIFIPRYGKDIDEVPFIIEKHDFLLQELFDEFGEAKVRAAISLGGKKDVDEKEGGEPKKLRTIWEVTTNEWKVWKFGNGILRKEKNPYYNFDNEGNNYFEAPRKNYIILSAYQDGKTLIGNTDLVTQGRPIQDNINTSKRTILNNGVKMGNATWRIDSEVMSEEEARNKINNAPGLIIVGKGAARRDMVTRDSPPPLPMHFFSTLAHSEAAFDNLFGTHSTTRGERGQQETLGGRRLLREADIGRIDMFTRELDRATESLGQYFVQLMKLFYKGEKSVRILGEEGASFIDFQAKNINKGMLIFIKAGTTMPTDPVAIREEALALWQQNALDPITLFQRLRFPNPEETAKKLSQWRAGTLFPPETQAETPTPPAPAA